MKSIKNDIELEERSEYPKLMIASTGNGDITLFTAPNEGTVVHAGKVSTNYIGYHSSAFSMSCFEDYHGTITLSNN